MRILFVINAFGTASGAENVLIDYIKTENRIDPYLLFIGANQGIAEKFQRELNTHNVFFMNCANKLQKSLSRRLFYPILASRVCKHIKAESTYIFLNNEADIDIVYYNNSFEASAFYSLFPTKKKIVHIHDMVDMFRPAQKRCVLDACMSAPQVLTASKACKQQLVKNGVDEQKITVAYNSINVKMMSFRANTTDVVNFGFVGSAIKRKGFDCFIDILNAVSETWGRARKIKATIITNSSVEDEYFQKQISRLNSDISREIFNNLPREVVFKKYEEMHLLLVPSRFDPLPTVVLEASMLGVPVMGSNKDGIPEMLCDDRMLFSTDNISEAAHKIEAWVNLPTTEQRCVIETVQKYISSTFTEKSKQSAVLESIERVMK